MMPWLTVYGYDRATGTIVRPCGVRSLQGVRRKRWRRKSRELPEAIEDLGEDTAAAAIAPIARLVDPEDAPDAPPTPDDEDVPGELSDASAVMVRQKARPDYGRFAAAMRAKRSSSPTASLFEGGASEPPARVVETSTAEATATVALSGRLGFGMRAELRERAKARFCEQCQQLVTPAAAAACASRWCKAGEKAA